MSTRDKKKYAQFVRRLDDSWAANEGKLVCNFDTGDMHAGRSTRVSRVSRLGLMISNARLET